jgi:xanthine dehydrogenase accessory protein XdhC
MLVTRSRIYGTIGGGRLEWEAQNRARAMLATGTLMDVLDIPLGPAVGQCCGGRVGLHLERAKAATVATLAALEAQEAQRRPRVLLCGAGHVGTALGQALAPLPLRVSWVDVRPAFAGHDGPGPVLADPVEAVGEARPNTAVIIVTHSHDLDFRIAEAALRRGDLSYVGLIGSATKRRRFERWFAARGGDGRLLPRLVCPIGEGGIVDKRPEVIAALTAAEVLRALGRAGALTDSAGQSAPQTLATL